MERLKRLGKSEHLSYAYNINVDFFIKLYSQHYISQTEQQKGLKEMTCVILLQDHSFLKKVSALFVISK